jgi:transcriptional regulatory protein RtcR
MQSHTHFLHRVDGYRHPILLSRSYQNILMDFKHSRRALAQFNPHVLYLSYPFGGYNDNAVKAANDAGFHLAARTGLLREADGGVLFLDEIAELGLDEQAMLLKAIEEKTFFPFGSDKEVQSDFQLIAGTHREMRQWVAEGRFREDLYARINMWSFALPGLAQRREDIAPNVEYELQRFATEAQSQVRFDKEARERYLRFATSSQALWRGNFRELSSSVARMATLAEQGRITLTLVEEEIVRLQESWQIAATPVTALQEIDLFDRSQLETVLAVCQRSSSLSEAGRELFAVSRLKKANPNDADRLRKYLARFGLSWESIRAGS